MDIATRNKIDDLCDEFDRGWERHDPDAISAMLDKVDPELRPELFRELVQIDQECCLKSGQTLAAVNYQARFPEYVGVLEELVAERAADEAVIETRSCDDSVPWPPLPQFPMIETIGGYRLEERIGEGGMGVVHRAVHEELGRSVALKIVAFPMADAVPRFQSEARTIAGLNHPHIVQIFETGEYQKRPYLVLELMKGGSLADVLQDEVLTPQRAAEIVLQITSAVSAAHKLGVIHRDLKPANVLMDEAGDAKLCDFGLARNLNVDSQTISGTMLGTPGFMSPEQTTGDTPTPAMDVYGLGAILYAALTGRPPFRGANIPDTLAMVRESDPVSVRALVPTVPVNLESICLKCLQNKPTGRYANAAELAEELSAFLDGRPVKARPAGPVEKLIRWCRRKPTIAALSAGLLIAVLAGTAGIVMQWQRAEANAIAFQKQATRADEQAARAEEEAATTAAVNEFMLDILAAAQKASDGSIATIDEAVKAALERVDGAFEGRPRVEAGVRVTLGDTLRSLDEQHRCLEQYRRALELSTTGYGKRNAHTLHVMDRLAGALRSFGDDDELTEAATMREFVLDQRLATLGVNDQKTITVMNNLATVWVTMGEFGKAEELYKRSIRLIEQSPDGKPDTTIKMRHNLAIVYGKTKQLGLAETELRKAVQDAEQLFATEREMSRYETTDLLKWKQTLASVLSERGKTEEAKGIFVKVFAGQRKLLGASHRDTLTTHRRLTRVLVELGDFENALPLLRTCVELHGEKYGPARGYTIDVRSVLARALIGLERFEDAEEFLHETVEIVAAERDDNKYTAQVNAELNEFLKSRNE